MTQTNSPKTFMPEQLRGKDVFESDDQYKDFRDKFIEDVAEIQDKWADCRRKSEQLAGQRLLR